MPPLPMMRFVVFLLCSAVVSPGLLLAGDPVPPPTTTPQLKWRHATGAGIVGGPLLTANAVIVGSGDGKLQAIDRERGTLLWASDTEGAPNCTPATADGLVFVSTTKGRVQAFARDSGVPVWSRALGHEQQVDIWDYYLSSPLVHAGTLFVGGGDGLYALEPGTGAVKWHVKTGGPVHGRPCADGERLFFGCFDGNLYAVDRATGELRWRFKTVGDRYFPAGAVQGSCTVVNGVVYFGSRDYNLYAVDAVTGTGWWNAKDDSWIVAPPLVEAGVAYYGTSDTHDVAARDAVSGRLLWRAPVALNIFAEIIRCKNWLVAGGFDGRIYGLDLTGKLAWTFDSPEREKKAALVFDQAGRLHPDLAKRFNDDFEKIYATFLSLGAFLSAPVTDGEIIYAASMDGSVSAFKP